MAYKDLHDEPFDESTIAKLEIFEKYAEAWIPTWVMLGVKKICIFDFFSGTGYDVNSVPGSPIRLLEKIKNQIYNINQKKVVVDIYFNEWQPNKKEQKKFGLLKSACLSYLNENENLKEAINVKFFNEDVETLFPKLILEIRKHPSLVYLDQNGIKFLAEKYLLELERSDRTDFLYFVSASYIWRFGESKEFKNYVRLDMNSAKREPYKTIHRSLIEQLRQRLPSDTKLKLYPFSLRKGSNVYGIIFGASHLRAVDKFLAIAWKKNAINGEANFDIDDDRGKAQGDLFLEKKLTKPEKFKINLEKLILQGNIRTNADALNYAYSEGHIGSHAAEVLKQLKKEGRVHFDNISPLITYEKVYKEKIILNYHIKAD